MIIVRSPLRITLGGGGTDMPSYYQKHGGFALTAAIDKYVYVAVSRPFKPGVHLKYSQLEDVERVDQVQHPIIREALKLKGIENCIDIVTLADVPAGTGLGSSSSFTTALVKALCEYQDQSIEASTLAAVACKLEIEKCGANIGKQDQYAAACGGLLAMLFSKDGYVDVERLMLNLNTLVDLEENLMLFFMGSCRDASAAIQHAAVSEEFLHFTKDTGMKSCDSLMRGDLSSWAWSMHTYWMEKRRLRGVTNDKIDRCYGIARANGALGGKLVGAGGGGFLLFYAEDKRRLRMAMAAEGLEELRFRFDFNGTKVVMS